MTRFLAFPAAVFHVQAKIVHQDIVVFRKTQVRGGLIDRRRRALQFHKRPDGRFVEFDQKTLGPGFRIGHSKGGAVFFIAKPAAHPQPFEDSGQIPGLGDLDFNLLADLV